MSNNKWGILKGKICPYCGEKSELVPATKVYPNNQYARKYSDMYWCKPCDAYVGCHQGTDIALGRLANFKLRELKKKAHSLFDPLWERKMVKTHMKKHIARNLAYEWLAREMGLPKDETHIGMFDEKQCEKVIELCSKYKRN